MGATQAEILSPTFTALPMSFIAAPIFFAFATSAAVTLRMPSVLISSGGTRLPNAIAERIEILRQASMPSTSAEGFLSA